jgi:hypothetical protein
VWDWVVLPTFHRNIQPTSSGLKNDKCCVSRYPGTGDGLKGWMERSCPIGQWMRRGDRAVSGPIGKGHFWDTKINVTRGEKKGENVTSIRKCPV